MKFLRNLVGFPLYIFILAFAAGCSGSPTQPAGAVTVTTAGPVAPVNGAQIANLAQPVTLVASNALVTDSSAQVMYTFEVATDAGFATKVATKDVPQTPGQTLLKLDTLGAGKDYFWHVRVTAGDTLGAFTNPLKFTIGPAIVINAPSPASPANGAVTTAWPVLTVTNATRSGPVGNVIYRFDVATSSAFTTIVVSATVAETANTTRFLPGPPAPTDTTQYFWRVVAIDEATGITGPASSTQSFTVSPPKTRQAKLAAQQGFTLWPGIQPPGTYGHATMGDNWEVQTMTSVHGDVFLSPSLENLRLFDLMDLGFDPQGAIDWMHANGYPTDAAYYSRVEVIGVQFIYLALINGRWDLILRSE
jgi:hypothetical protein